VHLGARHSVAAIDCRTDRAFDRREEAWPARAALELAIRDEQRLPTAGTGKRSCAVLGEQRTRAGKLSAVATKNRVLFWRQLTSPLVIGLHHRKLFFCHVTLGSLKSPDSVPEGTSRAPRP